MHEGAPPGAAGHEECAFEPTEEAWSMVMELDAEISIDPCFDEHGTFCPPPSATASDPAPQQQPPLLLDTAVPSQLAPKTPPPPAATTAGVDANASAQQPETPALHVTQGEHGHVSTAAGASPACSGFPAAPVELFELAAAAAAACAPVQPGRSVTADVQPPADSQAAVAVTPTRQRHAAARAAVLATPKRRRSAAAASAQPAHMPLGQCSSGGSSGSPLATGGCSGDSSSAGCGCQHTFGLPAAAQPQPASAVVQPAAPSAGTSAQEAAHAAEVLVPANSEVAASVAWEPVHSVLRAAAAFKAAAGQTDVAAMLEAAAAVAAADRPNVSRQQAAIGFKWHGAVGWVRGWSGPLVLVCLPDDVYAVVPPFCPACGVQVYSDAQFATGKLTNGGRPVKDDSSGQFGERWS